MDVFTPPPAGRFSAGPAQLESAEQPNPLYRLAVVVPVDAADREEADEEFRPMLFGI